MQYKAVSHTETSNSTNGESVIIYTNLMLISGDFNIEQCVQNNSYIVLYHNNN